jgi:hypothetical protein
VLDHTTARDNQGENGQRKKEEEKTVSLPGPYIQAVTVLLCFAGACLTRQSMSAVARGERRAATGAAKPSFNSVAAIVRPLAPTDRERPGEIHHRSRRPGRRDGCLCMSPPAAHMSRAGHRGGDPRRATPEGILAGKTSREYADHLGPSTTTVACAVNEVGPSLTFRLF